MEMSTSAGKRYIYVQGIAMPTGGQVVVKAEVHDTAGVGSVAVETLFILRKEPKLANLLERVNDELERLVAHKLGLIEKAGD